MGPCCEQKTGGCRIEYLHPFEGRHCFRENVLQVCEASRLNPRVVFEEGQCDSLVAMVAPGAGVTLLPEMSRQHYRHAGVRLLEFLAPQPARTIGVVKAKD